MDESNGSDAFLAQTWIKPTNAKIKSLWEWHDPDETPLRISISGTAGTAKKKVANVLGRKLGLPVIHSIPRTVQELGGNISKKADMDDEFMILLAQMFEEKEYVEFISAGSIIDIVAHIHWIAEAGDKKDKRILDAVRNYASNVSKNDYTVALYFPYRTKPRADGVRSVDEKYLREIDRLTLHYLNAFDLDYMPIEGSPSEKVGTILGYLDGFNLLDNRDDLED